MSAQPASGDMPKRADIEIRSDAQKVEHWVSGTLEDVLIEVGTTFAQYPSPEWGTKCDGIKYVHPNKCYSAKITRAKSCQ